MANWKKGDVVLVAITLDNFVIGEIDKVLPGDDTVYMKNPAQFSIQMTPGGPAPALIPLGQFCKNLVKYIQRAPCEYVYADLVDPKITEAYDSFCKKLFEVESGLVMPNASEVNAINKSGKKGNIIQFPGR